MVLEERARTKDSSMVLSMIQPLLAALRRFSTPLPVSTHTM